METGSRTTLVAVLLAGCAVVAGVAVALSTLLFVEESRWPGPAVDFWHFMRVLNRRAAGAEWVPLLVQEHGGHRLLVPKLLYLAEYEAFRGRNAFLLAVSLLLQLGTAALLAGAALRQRATVGAPLVAFAAGLSLVLLFSGGQAENFVRAWNVHWFLVQAAAGVAFAALARGARDPAAPAPGWLAAAGLAALVATWSMASGLLVWPILLGLAWLLRLPGRALGVLGAVSLAGAASFFVGYEPHGNVAPGRALAEPLAPLLWLARALGSPVAPSTAGAAACVGAAVLLAGAAAGWSVGRRRGRLAPGEALLAGLFLFGAGSLLAAATGRAASSWSEPRYQTAVLLAWASLAVWALLRAGRASPRGALAAMAGALALVLLPAGLGHRRGLAAIAPFVEALHAANLAILVGVEHRPSYRVTLPFADRTRRQDRVQRFAKGLRRRGQGMFADGHHLLLGTRVEPVDLSCPGRVEERVTLADAQSGLPVGQRLRGVVDDPGVFDREAPLLVSDPDGQVVGIGALRGARFTAFVRPRFTADTILARRPDGAACTLARLEAAPPPGVR